MLRERTAASRSTLPGPPRELQQLWPLALETEPLQAAARARRGAGTARAAPLRRVRVGGGARARGCRAATGDGVEATICARDFEIHVDLFVEPGAADRGDGLEAALATRSSSMCSRAATSPIEDVVLALCRARGLTLATAESCTGGLVAARLTSVPGSSDVFVGGVVAYANEVKTAALGVPEDVLARARRGLGRGRRGDGRRAPGAPRRRRGGRRDRDRRSRTAARDEKPVGLVYLHAAGPGGERGASFDRARRPRDGARARHGGGAAPRAATCHGVVTEPSQTRDTSPASVKRGDSLRLFCALRLPDDVLEALVRWQRRELRGRREPVPGERVVPPSNLHVTLAFLGARPATELPAIAGALRTAAAEAGDVRLRLRGYRETRSVGMLTFDDEGSGAAALAGRLHVLLEELGVYGRERARVAAARHRAPLPRARRGLRPPLPDLGDVRSVRRGCLHLTAAPRRGGVRGSREG